MQWLNIDLPEEFESISLIPFADTHDGAPEFNEKKFLAYRDWVLAEPTRFCLFNGDLVNNAVKSSVSNVYEEVRRPKAQVEHVTELIAPLAEAGRVCVVIEGNHEYRSGREVDYSPAERIASDLGVPFAAEGAYLRVRVGKQKDFNRKPVCYGIYVSHGTGGGKTEGAVANQLREMAISNFAHVYIMAHRHIALAFHGEYGMPDWQNKQMHPVQQLFVCVPSFVEWGGYAERKMLRRRPTGAVEIRLSGLRQQATATIGDIL